MDNVSDKVRDTVWFHALKAVQYTESYRRADKSMYTPLSAQIWEQVKSQVFDSVYDITRRQ